MEKHQEFIHKDILEKVSLRYHTITKAINREFWNSFSDKLHSLFVGSYGRNTAINTSDVDVLVELPQSLKSTFDNYSGNSQSRLLQAIRNEILASYPTSDVRADGQVVKIAFTDDIVFEVVPGFRSYDDSFTYPDTNNGGKWRQTNPIKEQAAMSQKNRDSNGLLYDTCKHIRYIRDNYFSSYHLSGIVIDSFVYKAIGGWRWCNVGESSSTPKGTYEKSLLNFFYQNMNNFKFNINAPGSNDLIPSSSSVECLEKVLLEIAKEN